MKILGVDPGSARTGYGLIIDRPKLTLCASGVIDCRERTLSKKILAAAAAYEKLLDQWRPDIVAIEKIFFTKNVKTALDVAHARGAFLFITARRGIALREYNPLQVKQAVTGYGSADKKAVAKMVAAILGIPPVRGFDDQSDAIAVAITAAHLTYLH